MTGGDAYNFWQKYRGGTTSKIKRLFESILRCYSYFKSFTELDFYALHPLDANCKDNSNDVVLTPKIKHWKKQKLDLNLRYDPAQNNVNWGRKWNVDFNTGKTLLVLFQYSNICGYWYEKGWICPWSEITFKMLRLTLSFKLYCGSYIAYIAKTTSRKIGALVHIFLWIYHMALHTVAA